MRKPKPISQRSTADLIALMLTVLVSFIMVFAIVAGAIWKILEGDDADLEQLLFRIGNLVNTLIGVVAGYLAGRSELINKKPPELPPEKVVKHDHGDEHRSTSQGTP